MLLKIMSASPLPDGDPRKPYRLFSGVLDVTFERHQARAIAQVTFDGNEEPTAYDVPNNAYIMTDDGKTVGTFTGEGS